MADRPMATAPEQSMAALSTSFPLMLCPLALAASVPCPISYAAPHAAMPPPMMRMSTSSSTICGLPNVPSAMVVHLIKTAVVPGRTAPRGTSPVVVENSAVQQLAAIRLVDAVGREKLDRIELGDIGLGLAVVRLDRAFRRGTDRELEALDVAVAELDGPHDRVGATQRLHRAAEGDDVGIVTALDRLLRADLHAGIAFPALLGFLVPGLHRMAGFGAVLVELHQVMGADVHAGGLVLTLAAIAFVGTYECWHGVTPSI